jgi:predicted ATP-dependent serine protease
MAQRGRPLKSNSVTKKTLRELNLVQMNQIEFDPSLFTPMKTNTIVDTILSSEGGLFPGTNTVVIGDPGVGKSTILLDLLASFHKQGKKVLFISGEMNEIDLHGYVKRFPKFGDIPILFLQHYDGQVQEAIESVLDEGYDCVLVDSWAEVNDSFAEENNCTKKRAESWLLDLMDRHNKAKNQRNKHTAFIVIQQMSKSGDFIGSNRIKHMTTSMAHLKFDGRGRDAARYMIFSKNRRGDVGEKIYFSLFRPNNVEYSFEMV